MVDIAQEPWGEGIGSTDTLHNTEGDDDIIGPHDSTVLEFLYSLGWIGTFIYGTGLAMLGFQLLRTGRGDSFVLSAKAILVGFLVQCLLNSVMLGVLGFMVWTVASMILAQAEMTDSLSEVNELQAGEAAGYAASEPVMRVLHILNDVTARGNGIVNTAVDLAMEQARQGSVVAVASAGGGYKPMLERAGVLHLTLDQSRRPVQMLRAFRLFAGRFSTSARMLSTPICAQACCWPGSGGASIALR